MEASRAAIEAERMRRVPGIYFMDGATGRRACVAGTGIDVWEIVNGYKIMGEDRARLDDAYDWLSKEQLDAALQYYALYPEEIDARIEMAAAYEREHYPEFAKLERD